MRVAGSKKFAGDKKSGGAQYFRWFRKMGIWDTKKYAFRAPEFFGANFLGSQQPQILMPKNFFENCPKNFGRGRPVKKESYLFWGFRFNKGFICRPRTKFCRAVREKKGLGLHAGMACGKMSSENAVADGTIVPDAGIL